MHIHISRRPCFARGVGGRRCAAKHSATAAAAACLVGLPQIQRATAPSQHQSQPGLARSSIPWRSLPHLAPSVNNHTTPPPSFHLPSSSCRLPLWRPILLRSAEPFARAASHPPTPPHSTCITAGSAAATSHTLGFPPQPLPPSRCPRTRPRKDALPPAMHLQPSLPLSPPPPSCLLLVRNATHTAEAPPCLPRLFLAGSRSLLVIAR